MGTLVVISSPSGAGKNSIIRKLLEQCENSVRFVTTTTRSMRPGEVNGEDYFFVSHEKFQSLMLENAFIEYNCYAGEYYGSEKSKLDSVLKKYAFVFGAIDIHGKHALDVQKISHISIFLLPENLEALEHRILARGGVDDQKLKERMNMATEEMKAAGMYDYRVMNREGKMDEAVQKIIEILEVF